jgi:hypothetical protein
MSIEVMRQALEYVQEFKRRWWAVPPFGNKVNKATREAVSAAHSPIFQIEDALRAAIEQAEKREPLGYWNAVQGWVELPDEPQPVAWVYPEALEAFQQGKPWTAYGRDNEGARIPLYTAPRQWVGLTDDEIVQAMYKADEMAVGSTQMNFARAIEAKLKEKNHDQK